MTLTCCTTAAFTCPRTLNGSLICTGKAPWWAQLLACRFSAQPCTPSSLCTKSLTMLKCLSRAHQCSPNMVLLQTEGMQDCSPRQCLISWAGLISVIIRCSGCFHMLWHSAISYMVNVKDGSLLVFSTPCMDTRLRSCQRGFRLTKQSIRDGFTRRITLFNR